MRWARGALALAAGDWSLHRMQTQVRCETHGETTLIPDGECDRVPPEGVIAWRDEPAPRPELTRVVLERGRDRFENFCAACHGLAGDGDSDVGRAMTLRKPPSLVDAGAKRWNDDRLFDAISSGYGVMPSYATLARRDRWAIVDYVRVLQRREVAFDSLSPELREEARPWLR